ncbi:MAG: C13 family peptidase [Gammaproteobacteria bacterium]
MKRLLLIFIIGCVAGAVLLKVKERLAFELPAPVAVLPDGARYEGDMMNGVIEGKGRMLWPGGDRYTGSFRNGRFQGQGRFEFAGGDVYEGEFTDGAMTGTGTMHYADGIRYTGAMKYGRADGKGTLVSRDSRYEGEFRSNRYEGTGKLTDKDGNVYTGAFRDGRFHGSGEFVTRDDRNYKGEFVDGEFTGEGVYTDKEGVRYEGRFEKWDYHGRGRLTDEEGDQYIGYFDQGSLKGEGEYIGKDGSHYKGRFEYGAYNGQGRLRTAAGDVYEGGFRYGVYDGKGTLTYAEPLDNVLAVTGVWQSGDLAEAEDNNLVINNEALAELTLYNQNELLQRDWQGLRDNDPRHIDMYFLGVAGDGNQAVFRREVMYVRDYFDRTFGTAGRSLVLVNDRKTVRDIPLATITSIKSSLGEIAKRMDLENDILFIYMTSHGSQEFEFTLDQAGMDIPELSSGTLAEILAELPVRWKVIVISACYAGGFIPSLRDEHTLIITAASADRTSFGCSDRAEFTYFGEAFFKDALPQSGDFAEAFSRAAEIVRKREETEQEKHSNPQIYKPDAILEHLHRWRADLRADTKLAGGGTVQ